MKRNILFSTFAGLLTMVALPALALASGSASIGGLISSTVGVGTTVTFSVIPSGFTNPTYSVIDSFGGGVNDTNIDQNGDLSWTPNNSDLGSHTITITVNDSLGDTASASQTITVTAPSISIGSLSPGATVKYGTAVTFSVSSVGFVGPQYTVADSFGYSTVSFGDTDSSGNFHWTPLYQDIGTHTLVATARDYQGHTATASQTITVTGPAGIALGPVSPNSTVHVGDAVTFTATTTGYISPTFAVADAFTSTLGTSSLAVDQTGKVTWIPNPNDIGVHVITVSAKDSSGNSGTAQTAVTVVPASGAYSVPVIMATTTTNTATALATPAASSVYTFKNFLTVGSTGADVTALQQLLVQLGFLTVTPTGYFGSLTKAALQKYQASHGIDTVGYAGPATRASLSTGK